MKHLLIVLGLLCVGLGTLGVFLPLIPTTPFLLAATFFFARSSDRLNTWLLSHRWFGPYLRNYREGTMTTGHKVRTLTLMWAGLILSGVLAAKPVVWLTLAIIGVSVSIHIALLGKR
ncbi:MAG: YbaN family protein [Corynebacterium sp.]|uniref:YbaN family protein n=1 Tax=Corynebacterium sp. TaxID=1720 RepID=UPI0026DD9805|nr:YbaN family protein [Corynebacterium sp.]MDO5030847.1 YbaN family protein [Corynebacterium sp.]